MKSFAEMRAEAAQSTEYWQERCALLTAEVRRLREERISWLKVICVKDKVNNDLSETLNSIKKLNAQIMRSNANLIEDQHSVMKILRRVAFVVGVPPEFWDSEPDYHTIELTIESYVRRNLPRIGECQK